MAIQARISIVAPIQLVFNTLTDLTNYSTWLSQSTAYKGTTTISPLPVQLGTTYIEKNPSGSKTGKVIKFENPTKVTFEQPLKLNPAWLGLTVEIVIRVRLWEEGEGEERVTVVERVTEVEYPGAFKLMRAVLDKGFITEGERTLEMLKKYVEGLEK